MDFVRDLGYTMGNNKDITPKFGHGGIISGD